MLNDQGSRSIHGEEAMSGGSRPPMQAEETTEAGRRDADAVEMDSSSNARG